MIANVTLSMIAMVATAVAHKNSDGSGNPEGASQPRVETWTHGHIADFAPTAAFFAVDPESKHLGLFLSEDADFCSHLEEGQVKSGARTLFFGVRSAATGVYAIDTLHSLWNEEAEFVVAGMKILDATCVDVGDDRNVNGPGIFPVGPGVGETGWLRLRDDADGAELAGEYSLSLGSEGFATTRLHGLFNASRCAPPSLHTEAMSCL